LSDAGTRPVLVEPGELGHFRSCTVIYVFETNDLLKRFVVVGRYHQGKQKNAPELSENLL
jgi:hypothetical protein